MNKRATKKKQECRWQDFEGKMSPTFQETDDLILVNIDDGSVSASSSESVELPEVPPAAADCFTQRCPPSHRDVSPLLPDTLTADDVALAPAGAPRWRSTLTCTSVSA